MIGLFRNKIIYIGICIAFYLTGNSQIIKTIPVFPLATDSVEIVYDASLGTGGLKGFTGDVYAHTGVITNASLSPSDWQYVKTGWGINIPATKMERIGTDLYSLKIKPSIRDYYSVPAGEKILRMAFVFRSAQPVGSGYLEGKGDGGTDLYAEVYEPGLQVMITKPAIGYVMLPLGDSIDVAAYTTTSADSLRLLLNGVVISSDIINQIDYRFMAVAEGSFLFVAEAWQAGNPMHDTLWVYVYGDPQIEPLPAGMNDGINIVSPGEVILVLYAPQKSFVHAIGDFNDWQPSPGSMMRKTPDNQRYWIRLTQLTPNRDYVFQYLVDGAVRIGDPYARLVADPWNDPYIQQAWIPSYPYGKTTGIATVFNTTPEPYVWKNQGFVPPAPADLVIYELLVRDFTTSHSYQGVIDSLAYLKTLGINAIELMPVNEFEGNSSWGYNPNYYFAVDKYYGSANDLKSLIDTCHQLGIAVILDVVYNHSFGSSPYVMLYWDAANNRPSAASPFYNMIEKHDFNVGFDLNHESQATRHYISRALKYWLEEFRVDGFRFDLSKGFTQKNTLGNVAAWGAYDASRVSILQMYADTVWSVNPDAYVILEHFADNSEERELSNRGMLLWGNLNHAYTENAMGYHGGGKSNFSGIYHKARGWSDPHLIGYMESHDEERVMFKCTQWGNSAPGYSVKDQEVALARLQANAAFFFTIPGPKMLWQFGELGYDYSIDYNGRTGEKPIRWDYFQNPGRRAVYDVYAGLLHLRSEEDVFRSGEMQYQLSGAVKRLRLSDGSLDAVVLGNFDVTRRSTGTVFPYTGIWYDYFSGDSLQVDDTLMTLSLAPGQYHLFLSQLRVTPYPVKPVWKIVRGKEEGLGSLFPNPTSGGLTLLLNHPATGSLQVDVFDTSGKLVGSTTFNSTGEQMVNLNEVGTALRTGVYHFRFMTDETTETHKVVIF